MPVDKIKKIPKYCFICPSFTHYNMLGLSRLATYRREPFSILAQLIAIGFSGVC